MRSVTLTLAFLFCTSPGLGAEIPLDEVWGFDMPNTKDVRELDIETKGLPTRELLRRSFVWRFQHLLDKPLKEGKSAGPVFLVQGVGKEALKNAVESFSDDAQEPERFLPANKPLSAVFYAYASSRYIRLLSVDREGGNVTITYRAQSHMSANVTSHFALIPVGEFPVGTTEIKVVQAPPVDPQGEPAKPHPRTPNFVCRPSSFGIR